MFLDWKNQYYENDYTTQSNLQIQCNPYQTTNGIFHRTRTKNFTNCMEILRQKNKAGGITFSVTKTQNMVLAQKQTHRSKEQNRELRNKPTHLWSINL